MKKFTSLFLVVSLLLLTLGACSGPSRVKVNGVKIDNEVYKYFEDRADNSLSKEDFEQSIEESIARYVAINSEFEKLTLSLSGNQKSTLSTTVNNLWHLYGGHYTDIGVSKQTLYKIEASKAYEKALLIYYYGENGASPVSEEQLKAYFNENYVAVRLVSGYLFNMAENGVNVPMTQEQKNNVVNSFNSVASMVNNGTTLEEAVSSLGSNTEIRDSLIFINDTSLLPEGFFAAAKAIETNKAAAASLGDYIFLIQRIDVFNEEYGYYSTYRADCLQKMKSEEFSQIVDGWAKNYEVK